MKVNQEKKQNQLTVNLKYEKEQCFHSRLKSNFVMILYNKRI